MHFPGDVAEVVGLRQSGHDGAQPQSPVTGTVLRAGTYTLYCGHVDNFLVVEPDARPGWEVKMLHFAGLSVAKGDRVEAGVIWSSLVTS